MFPPAFEACFVAKVFFAFNIIRACEISKITNSSLYSLPAMKETTVMYGADRTIKLYLG